MPSCGTGSRSRSPGSRIAGYAAPRQAAPGDVVRIGHACREQHKSLTHLPKANLSTFSFLIVGQFLVMARATGALWQLTSG